MFVAENGCLGSLALTVGKLTCTEQGRLQLKMAPWFNAIDCQQVDVHESSTFAAPKLQWHVGVLLAVHETSVVVA